MRSPQEFVDTRPTAFEANYGYNPEFLKRAREHRRQEHVARLDRKRRMHIEPVRILAPAWVRETVANICMKHGLSPAEVLGKRRFRYLIHCRHEIMWCLSHDQRKPSLPQIGGWLGGLDHTTVLHGARKHQAKLSKKEAA